MTDRFDRSLGAPRHDDAGRRIESAGGFVRDDPLQFGGPVARWQLYEAEPGVEGHVPARGSKGCERQPTPATGLGPPADRLDERRPDAAPAVPRMHVDLLEVGRIGREDLDVGEPDRFLLHGRHPQPPLIRRRAEHRGGGRVEEDLLRREPCQQACRGKFDVGQKLDVLGSCEPDDVRRSHRDVMPAGRGRLPRVESAKAPVLHEDGR